MLLQSVKVGAVDPAGKTGRPGGDPLAQLKTEHVKTEVKIRVTLELPTFLTLKDRVFEIIFCSDCRGTPFTHVLKCFFVLFRPIPHLRTKYH